MQQFKTISFNESAGARKTVTISFNHKEKKLYNLLSNLSSVEIRELIGAHSYEELSSAAQGQQRTISQQVKFLADKAFSMRTIQTKDVTFKGAKDMPFQRWYPYIEGYSPDFVLRLIEEYKIENVTVYEPFAGTGTTIFSADRKGLSCAFSEINPLLRLLIETKLKVLSMPLSERKLLADKVLKTFDSVYENKSHKDERLAQSYLNVFGKSQYFPDATLERILYLKGAIRSIHDSFVKQILNLAVATVLVPVSFLKKQGDLRFKNEKERKSEMKFIEDVLPLKIAQIIEDIGNPDYSFAQSHHCVTNNAKDIENVPSQNFGAVITSPPYLNGTNYIRNTKLELWFLGFLDTDKDLRYYRNEILTSGINDVKAEYKSGIDMGAISPLFKCTYQELSEKAYDKRIPLMALCYFREMHAVFKGLQHHLQNDATLLIDLGDSVFSNVHIQTDMILTEVLSPLNYSLVDRKVLRSRRSKSGKTLSQVLLAYKYSN